MTVKSLVDAWWHGGSWVYGREVERDLESIACKVGAGIMAGDFFFCLEGARPVPRLREKRARQVGERLR
jgi:hypothetical protein